MPRIILVTLLIAVTACSQSESTSTTANESSSPNVRKLISSFGTFGIAFATLVSGVGEKDLQKKVVLLLAAGVSGGVAAASYQDAHRAYAFDIYSQEETLLGRVTAQEARVAFAQQRALYQDLEAEDLLDDEGRATDPWVLAYLTLTEVPESLQQRVASQFLEVMRADPDLDNEELVDLGIREEGLQSLYRFRNEVSQSRG